jgi:hypothetical protein
MGESGQRRSSFAAPVRKRSLKKKTSKNDKEACFVRWNAQKLAIENKQITIGLGKFIKNIP